MADYWIATDGNDTTGDGSEGNPWLTLGKFITESISGDTCNVEDGTYNVTETHNLSGLNVQAVNNGLAIFNGDAATVYDWVLNDTTFTGIVFQNLKADEARSVGIFSAVSGGDDSTFNNCIFKNNKIAQDSAGNKGPLFTTNIDVTFHFNTCLIYGTYTGGTNTRSSIFLGPLPTARPLNISLINTTVAFNVSGSTKPSSFISVGNTGGVNSVFLKNCIIANYSEGVTFALPDSGVGIPVSEEYSYTDFFDITPGSATLTGTGVITDDPLFIDENNDDFNLAPSSPCIDTGILI